MQFEFTGVSKLTVEVDPVTNRTSLVKADVGLEIPSGLDASRYVVPDTVMPNSKDGCRVLSNTFVHGLIASINGGDQYGYWDAAEHLEYIKQELDRAYAAKRSITEGTM